MRGRDIEGMADAAVTALSLFSAAAREAYGDSLSGLVLFGSRARGDANRASDLDVAVLLPGVVDRYREKMRLADLAYDAIVETGIHVQPWPVAVAEWEHPELYVNPPLVREMRRDGIPIEHRDVRRSVPQGA